jgi:hypothetical protein
LLLVVAAGSAAFAFYYSWVDFAWLVEETVRTTVPPGADPAHADAIRDFMRPGLQVTMSVIGIAVMTVVIYAIQSLYLHLVNKVAGDASLRYGQWFALSAWTGFVGIFNVVAMAVVMLMSDSNQLGPEALSPLSMNALFVHAEPGAPCRAHAPGEPLAHGVQTVAQLATPLVLAFTLFGIATLKARVFPRWTGWLQIAAVPMALIGSMVMEAFLSERLWNTWPAGISPLAFGYYMVFIGYAGAGYRLWSEGRISPTVTENESRATEPKASVQIS